MHQTSSKHPYSRTISITSDNPSELFFSAEEDLTLTGSIKTHDRVTLGSARCSSLKSSLNNSGIGQNESFIKLVFDVTTTNFKHMYILCICLRNHFGSDTTIIPNSSAISSNTTVSHDTSIDPRDHTIINIDTIEVKIEYTLS